MKVAVYGTLKKGGVLHSNMDNLEFVGEQKLIGFNLYQEKGCFYPYAKRGNGEITVEVYEGPDHWIDHLDMVEGCNGYGDDTGLFSRKKVGDTWIYLGGGMFDGKDKDKIEGGNFDVV